MAMTKNDIDRNAKNYNSHLKTAAGILDSPEFSVSDKIKSEYDMWSWIFQEISNIRMEVSRLSVSVRVNNSSSPNFLRLYHAHIFTLLIDVSPAIQDTLWDRIEKYWIECETDINNYFTQKANVPNKKIPNILIKKLDKLYRIALLAIQKAGLGFKVTMAYDFEKAIEKSITG